MKSLHNNKSIIGDERGLSTVEYVIILVLIAIAGITLWQTFGDTLQEKITTSTESLSGMS